MIIALFKLIGIFLILLFFLIPIFKELFKLCFKECKKQEMDIRKFIEEETKGEK